VASEAEKIVDLYQRHAHEWAAGRGNNLFETPWLDRFLTLLAPQASILDIGCGSGEPIARYFIEKGYEVIGVDSSPTLIDLCKAHFPYREWIVADMRMLSLGRAFAGILAWDSFFHLCPTDQRRMFPICRAAHRPDVHERPIGGRGYRHLPGRAALPCQLGLCGISLAARSEWLRCRIARRRGPYLRQPYHLARATQIVAHRCEAK
jgi:SAM-dependent methyltransferase